MSDSEDPLVVLYHARDLMEAEHVQAALQNAGIVVRLEGEYLGTALGDIPLGLTTSPRLVVRQADAREARLVLDDWLKNRPQMTELMADELEASNLSESIPSADNRTEVEVHPMSNREIGWEILAVAAIGIVPNLVTSIFQDGGPVGPAYGWTDAARLMGYGGCALFATLYIIARSGESWEAFGITRLRLSDLWIALGLMMMTKLIWKVTADYIAQSNPESEASELLPHIPSLSAFYVLTYFVAAASEEVIMRAYLLSRLATIWKSEFAAACVSSALFAAYHSYQGFANLASIFLFGLLYSLAFLLFRRVWPLTIGHALSNCLALFELM